VRRRPARAERPSHSRLAGGLDLGLVGQAAGRLGQFAAQIDRDAALDGGGDVFVLLQEAPQGGAIDLENGKTAMVDVETVDAASTIRLLEAIEAMYPLLVMIHVFLDNARYHHAKIVQEWLAQPGRRVTVHFILASCPHLNAIERLWGLMHTHLTHNKTYATYREFAEAALDFLRNKVPKCWPEFCDSVTDNFRVINPKDFRVLALAGIHHKYTRT
jgi:hypothetical protein